MIRMDYEILLYKDEDGVYIAECVTLPGCISDGKTKENALKNIKEAIQAYTGSVEKEILSTKPNGKIVKLTI